VPGAINLLKTTPIDILCDLGIRAYVGSRDMPKNQEVSLNLLDMASEYAKDDRARHMASYYSNMIAKFQLFADLGAGQANPNLTALVRAELEGK
jgi:hypothetical protein